MLGYTSGFQRSKTLRLHNFDYTKFLQRSRLHTGSPSGSWSIRGWRVRVLESREINGIDHRRCREISRMSHRKGWAPEVKFKGHSKDGAYIKMHPWTCGHPNYKPGCAPLSNTGTGFIQIPLKTLWGEYLYICWNEACCILLSFTYDIEHPRTFALISSLLFALLEKCASSHKSCLLLLLQAWSDRSGPFHRLLIISPTIYNYEGSAKLLLL